jgi:hypothetical protein
MSLTSIELTTALRPSLQPDETLLFVQDAVGLYQGYDDTNEQSNRLDSYDVAEDISFRIIRMDTHI